jgi:hypothetical protein
MKDKTMLAVVSYLSFSENKINNVKGNVPMETMENLNKANEILNKLKDSDVRIIYLPPMTVAAVRGFAHTEKGHTVEKFVRETGLLKIKPDARGMVAYNFSQEDLKAEHYVRTKEKECNYSVRQKGNAN